MTTTSLIHKNPKAPLSILIKKEYDALIGALSRVPIHARSVKAIEGTGGTVSVADLIAYQIGWGTLLIRWYTAGIENRNPEMPGAGFTTWDYTGLARYFYTAYHYDGAHEQEKEVQRIVNHIITIIETEHQTGNLDKLNVWPWCTLASGKTWPLSKWIRVNTISPYKRATALIKKYTNFLK